MNQEKIGKFISTLRKEKKLKRKIQNTKLLYKFSVFIYKA